MRDFWKPLVLGAANTPVNIATALVAGGYTGFLGLADLIIANDSSQAGNLVITSNAAATAETDGQPVDALELQSGGSISDTIDPTSLYLISATAAKQYTIYVRPKV